MSRAERLAKQQERSKAEADEYLRRLQALAPKRMAVYVANCFQFIAWRELHAAHWVDQAANKFPALIKKIDVSNILGSK